MYSAVTLRFAHTLYLQISYDLRISHIISLKTIYHLIFVTDTRRVLYQTKTEFQILIFLRFQFQRLERNLQTVEIIYW